MRSALNLLKRPSEKPFLNALVELNALLRLLSFSYKLSNFRINGNNTDFVAKYVFALISHT